MQTKIIGITGTFAMLVILGIVVIMTANKFFSLIHYLPEHVTNWIGQQFHALGEKGRPGRCEKTSLSVPQCGFLWRSWSAGTARRHFTAMEQPRRGQRPDFNAAGPLRPAQAGLTQQNFQELIWIFSTRKNRHQLL